MASSDTTKPAATGAADDKQPAEHKTTTTTTTALGEDDEFEDFPVDDWPEDQTEAASGGDPKHLWEESWDDDDTSDDFSAQLREELKKVEAAKPRS